jgi:hypothetical protein
MKDIHDGNPSCKIKANDLQCAILYDEVIGQIRVALAILAKLPSKRYTISEPSSHKKTFTQTRN